MAIAFRVSADGFDDVQRVLKTLDVKARPRPIARGLTKIGLLVQKIATQDVMIRGGQGPPHPTRLTSRTGTLRRSYSVNRRRLPQFVEVGTPLIYGRTHELGFQGTVTVRRHERSVAFGRRTSPFSVGPYQRRMNLRARPVLQPALRKAQPRMQPILLAEIAKETRRAGAR